MLSIADCSTTYAEFSLQLERRFVVSGFMAGCDEYTHTSPVSTLLRRDWPPGWGVGGM